MLPAYAASAQIGFKLLIRAVSFTFLCQREPLNFSTTKTVCKISDVYCSAHKCTCTGAGEARKAMENIEAASSRTVTSKEGRLKGHGASNLLQEGMRILQPTSQKPRFTVATLRLIFGSNAFCLVGFFATYSSLGRGRVWGVTKLVGR